MERRIGHGAEPLKDNLSFAGEADQMLFILKVKISEPRDVLLDGVFSAVVGLSGFVVCKPWRGWIIRIISPSAKPVLFRIISSTFL